MLSLCRGDAAVGARRGGRRREGVRDDGIMTMAIAAATFSLEALAVLAGFLVGVRVVMFAGGVARRAAVVLMFVLMALGVCGRRDCGWERDCHCRAVCVHARVGASIND